MVGAVGARGEERGLDLPSRCWNVTWAAQTDGAAVRTPPPHIEEIHGKSDANALYCIWAPIDFLYY